MRRRRRPVSSKLIAVIAGLSRPAHPSRPLNNTDRPNYCNLRVEIARDNPDAQIRPAAGVKAVPRPLALH